MSQWVVILYPVSLAYLGWFCRPRTEDEPGRRETAPRIISVGLNILACALALAAVLIAVFGPALIFHTFFRWSLDVAVPVGIAIGLVVFTAWVVWIAEGSAAPTRLERLRVTAGVARGWGSIVLFVVGQVTALALGGIVGSAAASGVLRYVELGAVVEEAIPGFAGMVGGFLLMFGYCNAAMRWQDRRNSK